jgi:sulfur relay (sulfurtransferase) DsrC/TusE family protein
LSKAKINNKLFIVILIIVSIILGKFIWQKNGQETRALFSWKDSEVLEGRRELFEVIKELKLNTVYQSFSKKLSKEEILRFLEEASNKNIDIYLLAGSPEWAVEEEAESMCYNIDKVIEINKGISRDKYIKGILFDVEPYLLEEWDKENSEKIMKDFVKNMEIAYKKAHDSGIEVIVCIPYFYDNFELSNYVKTLIRSACDKVAIMNYYQGKEYEHIQMEADIIKKYGKSLINIYELQPPGKYGLTDKNTYYEEGIESVEKNFKELKKSFHGQDISIAFHEYEALREVMEGE